MSYAVVGDGEKPRWPQNYLQALKMQLTAL